MPNGWRPSPSVAPAGGLPWLGAGSPAGGAPGTITPCSHSPGTVVGQGPGDDFTGSLRPSGGSGPSGVWGYPPGGAVLPRADAARPRTPAAISSHLALRPSTRTSRAISSASP